MSIIGWFAVAAGGMIGALIRYFLSAKLNRKRGFPAGTFVANMAGALLAGIFSGLGTGGILHQFIVYGLLGALTTFSTWNSEILFMWQEGRRGKAILYGLSTLVFGIVLYLFSYMYLVS